MVNRTVFAALLLALAAPSWADEAALGQARTMANGGTTLGSYDGGCTGGSCGARADIERASNGALQTGNLVVADGGQVRQPIVAEVPAPTLSENSMKSAKDKPGFFSKLFSGKGLLYGLGGAAAGAGIGWLVGGPIGAVIGGLLGAVGGFFLSKLLSK